MVKVLHYFSNRGKKARRILMKPAGSLVICKPYVVMNQLSSFALGK